MATRHLGVLIEQVQRLNGLSLADMAKRASARGERLSKSNTARVASGDNPNLSRATIYGLAAGLGVTPATVARAALADMGIILAETDSDTETAIRTDPTLPEHGRRMLLALLAEIRSTSAPGRAAPKDQAATRFPDDDWEVDNPSGEDLQIVREVAAGPSSARTRTRPTHPKPAS